MTEQEKYRGKKFLKTVVMRVPSQPNIFYEAPSPSPNNAYQPYLRFEIPIKKLLKATPLQETCRLSLQKNKKTICMNLRDLFSLITLKVSKEHAKGDFQHGPRLRRALTTTLAFQEKRYVRAKLSL